MKHHSTRKDDPFPAYPKETVITNKLEIMDHLKEHWKNSSTGVIRTSDFHDHTSSSIWAISSWYEHRK